MVIEERMYDKPVRGGSITGNLVDIIGERTEIREGKILDFYLYNICGYKPSNGRPFVALKSNIFVL